MAVESARAIVNLKKGHFERENERPDKYTLGDELPAKLSELSLRRPAPAQAADTPPANNTIHDEHEYAVRRLTPDDKEELLHFLRKFFFRDEPMNVAVELLETADARCLALEEYATASVEDGVSVVAVDRAGDIVGVVVNGISRKDEPVDVSEKADLCPDKKFSKVLRLLAHLDEHARLWEHVRVRDADSVLEVRIASTHAAWRGRGLMRRLCEETEDIARKAGCGALRMDTTSAFSAAAAERLRYTRVYSVAYAAVPGAPVPQPPHTHASVYIKLI